MDSPSTTAAIIPCFNEARGITALIRQVRIYLPAVIVVDDGSGDSTAVAALAAGARVLRHERNRGKGAAINTGLAAAWESGFRQSVLLDGDGQHQPKSIPALLACAEATGAGLVIGNRMDNPEAMSWLRRWVNRWMSRQISRLAGQPLPDTQCGFRVLSLAVWRGFRFVTEHFETESEMVLNFAKHGCRVEFVPVETIRGNRPSHIQPLRDTLRWINWWRKVERHSPPSQFRVVQKEIAPPSAHELLAR